MKLTDGYTPATGRMLTELRPYLLNLSGIDKSPEDRHEVLAAVNLETGVMVGEIRHGEHRTVSPEPGDEELWAAAGPIVLMHTHPVDGTFSGDDFYASAALNGRHHKALGEKLLVPKMLVFTPDGSWYEMGYHAVLSPLEATMVQGLADMNRMGELHKRHPGLFRVQRDLLAVSFEATRPIGPEIDAEGHEIQHEFWQWLATKSDGLVSYRFGKG